MSHDAPEIARALRLSLARARRLARQTPRMREEFESAASWGVFEAVRYHRRGVGKSLSTIAHDRVVTAIRDARNREIPLGCGRRRDLGPIPRVRDLRPGDEERTSFRAAPDPEPMWLSADVLRSALRGLPAQHRRMLTLTYLEDLPQAEAGRRLGVGYARASLILKHALAMLRDDPRALARLRCEGVPEVPNSEAAA